MVHYTETIEVYDMKVGIVQIGHDVGGNFNIHFWEGSGDFIVRNR